MTIDDVFCNVYGKPAWGMKRTHGSSLIMEFGDPHLQIREPIRAVQTTSERIVKRFNRRKVSPCGEWSLLIEDCNWSIILDGKVVSENESPHNVIEDGLENVDGQLLISVQIEPELGCSSFLFDLHGELKTWPSDRMGDQWTLYGKDGSVFVYRGDGMCFSGSSQGTPNESDWFRLMVKK